MNFELNIVILFPQSFIIGFDYLESEENFEYQEVNIYLGLIQLQYRWN